MGTLSIVSSTVVQTIKLYDKIAEISRPCYTTESLSLCVVSGRDHMLIAYGRTV